MTRWMLAAASAALLTAAAGQAAAQQQIGPDSTVYGQLETRDPVSSTGGRFDRWREVYNTQRPHQAIGDLPPATRYRVANPRHFPERLPPLVYPDGLPLRRVQDDGRISYGGRPLFLSGAFAGETVALRPTATDGVFDVLYAEFVIDKLDCTQPS